MYPAQADERKQLETGAAAREEPFQDPRADDRGTTHCEQTPQRGSAPPSAADRGKPEEAESFARQAVSYAYETDFGWARALVRLSLAHVLTTAGRTDEAREELNLAIEIYEVYGNTFEADRARALLVEL